MYSNATTPLSERRKALLRELMEISEPAPVIRSAADAYSTLLKFRNKKQEHFLAILLDSGHKVIKVATITKGLVNRTIVHPREVFRPAIAANACAVILAHNHPSGSLTPSNEDEEMKKRLNKAGEILGIPVLDNIIISRSGYYSYGSIAKMPSCKSLREGFEINETWNRAVLHYHAVGDRSAHAVSVEL